MRIRVHNSLAWSTNTAVYPSLVMLKIVAIDLRTEMSIFSWSLLPNKRDFSQTIRFLLLGIFVPCGRHSAIYLTAFWLWKSFFLLAHITSSKTRWFLSWKKTAILNVVKLLLLSIYDLVPSDGAVHLSCLILEIGMIGPGSDMSKFPIVLLQK